MAFSNKRNVSFLEVESDIAPSKKSKTVILSAKEIILPWWSMHVNDQLDKKSLELKDSLKRLVQQLRLTYKDKEKDLVFGLGHRSSKGKRGINLHPHDDFKKLKCVPASINIPTNFIPEWLKDTDYAVPMDAILSDDKIDGYKNKIDFTFGWDNGCPRRAAVGFKINVEKSGSSSPSMFLNSNSLEVHGKNIWQSAICPPYDCQSVPNTMKVILKHVTKYLNSCRIKPYDSCHQTGVWRTLSCRTATTSSSSNKEIKNDCCILICVSTHRIRPEKIPIWEKALIGLVKVLKDIPKDEVYEQSNYDTITSTFPSTSISSEQHITNNIETSNCEVRRDSIEGQTISTTSSRGNESVATITSMSLDCNGSDELSVGDDTVSPRSVAGTREEASISERNEGNGLVTGICLQVYDGVSSPPPNHPMKILFGRAEVFEQFDSVRLQISPKSSFQSNTGAAELLVDYVLDRVLEKSTDVSCLTSSMNHPHKANDKSDLVPYPSNGNDSNKIEMNSVIDTSTSSNIESESELKLESYGDKLQTESSTRTSISITSMTEKNDRNLNESTGCCLLNLYCGIGAIGTCFLKRLIGNGIDRTVSHHSLIGIDACLFSILDARKNLEMNNLDDICCVSSIKGSMAEVLSPAMYIHGRPEAILPRLLQNAERNIPNHTQPQQPQQVEQQIPSDSAPSSPDPQAVEIQPSTQSAPEEDNISIELIDAIKQSKKLVEGKRLVVVASPPREGFHPETLSAIRTCVAIRRLVYISNNPSKSLLKDTMILCGPNRKGSPFVPVRACPVDLSPMTPACDLVLVLDR